MTQQVQIGLIGLGTVGTGVARALIDKGRLLEKRIGSRLVLKRACDRNVKRGRALRLSPSVLTTDARVVLRDPAIQVVVELIGGIEPQICSGSSPTVRTSKNSGKASGRTKTTVRSSIFETVTPRTLMSNGLLKSGS